MSRSREEVKAEGYLGLITDDDNEEVFQRKTTQARLEEVTEAIEAFVSSSKSNNAAVEAFISSSKSKNFTDTVTYQCVKRIARVSQNLIRRTEALREAHQRNLNKGFGVDILLDSEHMTLSRPYWNDATDAVTETEYEANRLHELVGILVRNVSDEWPA